MSNSVFQIEENAFAGCVELNDIILSASLTQIQNGLFQGCSGLESIIIEDNIESIGDNAFADCSNLKTIKVKSGIPATAQDNSFSIASYWDGKLVVPLDCSDIYKQAPVWRKFEHIEESSEPASNFTYATSIFLNKTSATVTEGETLQLTATVLPTNATNRIVTWKSSDDAVAAVDATGLVTAVAPGVATITATTTDGTNLSAACALTVQQNIVYATSISLNKTSATVTEGNTLQLTATVLPTNATNKTVTWASSDEAVATVNSTGLVTAVAPGTATITATTTDGTDLSASCNVTVLQGVQAESIKLNVTTAGLNEGSSLQLTATVLPENSDKTVLWASNNPSVATVDSNGLVTTHSVGTATITAITTDGSNLSTTCTVTLFPVGVKGDVNGDSKISISDVTTLIDYLLSGHWPE